MLILAALVFTLFTAAYFVLQNEQLQSKVVRKVTKEIEARTGADVYLDRIDWNFPNAFIINQFYISDEEKDTLLYVDRAKVTLNVLPLLKSCISFRTIQFTEADARIKYLKDRQKYNYDFLVDAFTTPNDTTTLDWDFDLESLAFTDCKMEFVTDDAIIPVDSVFCPQNIALTDINGALFIKESMFSNSQEFRLHRLHFKERSGLELSNLSTTVTVSDDEIATAILTLIEQQKLVTEGAGAVSVAAVMFNKIPVEGKKVVCLVSGGNIDVTILSRVIKRGLLTSGRTYSLTIELVDKPGQLKGVSNIIADLGGNVISIHHERASENSDINGCFLRILLETRNFQHIELIKNELISQGYKLV